MGTKLKRDGSKWGGGKPAPAVDRFMLLAERTDGCWMWKGAIQSSGYGSFASGGKGRSALAHRWIYEHHFGPISKGLTIDHICRNRLCVNPSHMEAVTISENIKRAWAARKAAANEAPDTVRPLVVAVRRGGEIHD